MGHRESRPPGSTPPAMGKLPGPPVKRQESNSRSPPPWTGASPGVCDQYSGGEELRALRPGPQEAWHPQHVSADPSLRVKAPRLGRRTRG